MSAQKLQTSKEWNKNSPDLVYHQLVPARFNLLWFETDPAVLTVLTALVCYIVTIYYEYNYGISLPNRQSKIHQIQLLEQSAKYSCRQNFQPYGYWGESD